MARRKKDPTEGFYTTLYIGDRQVTREEAQEHIKKLLMESVVFEKWAVAQVLGRVASEEVAL